MGACVRGFFPPVGPLFLAYGQGRRRVDHACVWAAVQVSAPRARAAWPARGHFVFRVGDLEADCDVLEGDANKAGHPSEFMLGDKRSFKTATCIAGVCYFLSTVSVGPTPLCSLGSESILAITCAYDHTSTFAAGPGLRQL